MLGSASRVRNFFEHGNQLFSQKNNSINLTSNELGKQTDGAKRGLGERICLPTFIQRCEDTKGSYRVNSTHAKFERKDIIPKIPKFLRLANISGFSIRHDKPVVCKSHEHLQNSVFERCFICELPP